MNEQETRTRLIYPKIREAGWQVKDIREEYPVQEGMLVGNGKRQRNGYGLIMCWNIMESN